MANLNKIDLVDIDLNANGIFRSFLNKTIGLNDNQADSFGVRVFRDGEPVDLTGAWVQGFFRNPRGENIALTSHGTFSGNAAYVTLPQACYNYEGQFTLAIKIVSPGSANTVTMRIVDGMVDNTNVGGAVAPTSTVPTYQEVLAVYDDMVAATTAATTAATNVGSIVAAAYSTSATYAVGDYCTKDGNLYRCTTAITTAESWTAAHWTQTKMGLDVSDLKSALDNTDEIIGAYGNLVSNILPGYARSNNNGVVSAPWASTGYVAAEADVKAGTYISSNSNWIDNSFGMFANDSGTVIGRADTYKDTSKGDYIYQVPTGATKLYFSINTSGNTIYDNYGYVVLQRDTQIVNPRLAISEYPYGVYAKYKTENLFYGTMSFAELLTEILKSPTVVFTKANLSDLDNAPDNSCLIFALPVSTPTADIPAHYPESSVIQGYGILLTVKGYDQSIKSQFYIAGRLGKIYAREFNSSTWGNWYVNIDTSLSVSGKAADANVTGQLLGYALKTGATVSPSDLTDFNSASGNSIIQTNFPASTPTADIPANYPSDEIIPGVCLLITTVDTINLIKTQTYFSIRTGDTWSRVCAAGTWQQWFHVPKGSGGRSAQHFTCKKSGSADFNSLVSAINYINNNNIFDAVLHVGAGTWNIIDELGSTYMNNVSSNPSTWGLVLKNRLHIIGSSNSKITAKYTGSNTNVKTYFSAFNAGEYGFTLENLNIETDNIRYTIHDDRGADGGEGYVNRYIGCSMKHTNGQYTDCIGGGIGTNGLIEIINCYFEGDANATRLAYYHGNNYSGQTDAQCKIIVTGNYFAFLGTFGLTKYGDSTKVTKAYVSNNSVGSALFVNSGSYAPQDNMQMIEWNNVLRD